LTNNFLFLIEKQLEAEIVIFTEFISNTENLKNLNSSNLFWHKNVLEMPKLGDLYLLLSNIPALILSASLALLDLSAISAGFK